VDENPYKAPQETTPRPWAESLLSWLSLGFVGLALGMLWLAVRATIVYVDVLGAPRWSASIGHVLLALACVGFSRVIFPPFQWKLFLSTVAAFAVGVALVVAWLELGV
jgi:hypothetical protein